MNQNLQLIERARSRELHIDVYGRALVEAGAARAVERDVHAPRGILMILIVTSEQGLTAPGIAAVTQIKRPIGTEVRRQRAAPSGRRACRGQ
jgi:hypothetical protein